ncbi:hypothetical protein [Corynebacterium sp. 13CS0277]|uniref:hypothetical protein n=1 Tax=Corynebacterium sp. 13CS0277 TaxID=2071994 RepID=UPI001E494D34|nr:hypothetical protein [Corynebacterium sp. 13CS0277]
MPVPSRSSSTGVASEDDWDLVFTCLPSVMAEQLPPGKIAQIASYLTERLDAGWERGRIREILNGRTLPDQVGNMTGLVIARLRDDVPVAAAPPSRDELRRRRQEKRDAQLAQQQSQLVQVKAAGTAKLAAEMTPEEREAAQRRRRELFAQKGITLGANRPGGRT